MAITKKEGAKYVLNIVTLCNFLYYICIVSSYSYLKLNMKIFNLFIMILILSGLLLTVCEDNSKKSYNPTNRLYIENKHVDEFISVHTVTVSARNWRNLSSTDRFIDITLPAITQNVLETGIVSVYLNEAGKYLALPFTYYQGRRAMSFQPSYEIGHLYINILGNFVININSSYSFKIIIADSSGLKNLKELNWQNYNEIKAALKLEN